MITEETSFILSYEGENADKHELDFYDASHALMGFQRSLAITAHLILNNEVITQAPSLKNARIFIRPPEEGSWKAWAILSLLGTATYQLGTAPRDTPIGHLVSSAYDYVVSQTLGFHIDYDKSIGELYEEHNKKNETKLTVVKQSQLDSVIEKCEASIKEMHRPIVFSATAESANISSSHQGEKTPFESILDINSYEYINFTDKSTDQEEVHGYISSYNSNTFKGRIYIPEMRRPITFILADLARNNQNIGLITRSLHMNSQEKMQLGSQVCCTVFKNLSRNGRLKSLTVIDVTKADI